MATWQRAQQSAAFVPATGLSANWSRCTSLWQAAQYLSVTLKGTFVGAAPDLSFAAATGLWQARQATFACRPSSLNSERLWSNATWRQLVSLWQTTQAPAAASTAKRSPWPSCGSRWQSTHRADTGFRSAARA